MTDKVRDELKEQGFNINQIHEIEAGLQAGVDISVYARQEYFAIQMRQIRLGLEEGADVTSYADKAYDWFQMEEIRLGILQKVDIGKYADPKIPYDKMRQVREGLSAGIDLTPFLQLNAGLLRELRISMARKINIVPYIKKGYQVEQLEQIRIALEKKVDIVPYLTTEMHGASIAEICRGLEHGLDVGVYAKPEYGWQQMREIRLGLENRVDVAKYTDSYFDWQQMREIRLGLEAGLDVTGYCSLMYTPREMKKRRVKLEREHDLLNIIDKKAEETEHFHNFDIKISSNEMEAYIAILTPGLEPSKEEIMQALHKSGVRAGILEEEVERISKGIYFYNPAVIARGKEPEEGEKGWYEYFFKTKKELVPKILPDGSVDYQNTQWFEVVKQNQKLAYYHEAKAGMDGYTVTGRLLPGRSGREQPLLYGRGFVLLPDKKTYMAAIDGRIDLQGTKLEITRMMILEDVNMTSGMIDFDGSVYVRGNIGSGAMIRATEDIIVDGYVEGANVESMGNIVLRQGANATGAGCIRATGSIMGKFFESARIYAGQDIQANYCMNSELYAEGKIEIRGTEGILVGGSATAVKGISVGHAGNRIGLETKICVGINDRMRRVRNDAEEQIRGVEKELDILRHAYMDFIQKYPPEVRSTMELFLKVESAIFTKEKQMDELQMSRHEMLEVWKANRDVKAVVHGHLFEGVNIEINGQRWDARSLYNVTLRVQQGRVAVYSNK